MEFSDLVINFHRVVSTVFVVLAIILLIRSFRGWSHKKEYTILDRRIAVNLLILLYVQLVLGLLLYFVLDNLSLGANSIEEATRQISLRFWALEHLIIMMFALFLSQLGWIFIRKARLDLNKHKNTLFYFGTSFLLILISTGIAIFWR
jgi:hypothetical protein